MIVQFRIPVDSWPEGFSTRQVVSTIIESYGYEIDGYGYGVQQEEVRYVDVNLLINIDRERPVILFSPEAFQRLCDDIQQEYPQVKFGAQKKLESMLALQFPKEEK